MVKVKNKNIPSVDDLMDMHETIDLFLERAGFGRLFLYNPDNLKDKKFNQLAISLYLPLMSKLISIYNGVDNGEGKDPE